MALPILSNTEARRIFLDRHLLSARPSGVGKGADLLSVIEDLGFVQLDSVNTLARAHDLILFSRRNRYRPKDLRRLYDKDRALFEHWTHDAAVIPKAFYPHWALRFQRDTEQLKERWAKWREPGYEKKFQTVLDHIREHGPVCSADFAPKEGRKSGGWWDWHPSKTALEFLWRSGALAVTSRRGFQKVYDLTERVIEENLRLPETNLAPQDTIDWKCANALDRLGFATPGELAAFWATVTPQEARDWVAKGLAQEKLCEAIINDVSGNGRKVVLRKETLLPEVPSPVSRMRVLSPFDPAIRNRQRTERLFGFHYRIEIFTPAPKRQYGYYVFPLLEGDRFVGRVDMKADRETGTLRVQKVWPELGVQWGKNRQKLFEDELGRIAVFADLDRIEFADDWLAN